MRARAIAIWMLGLPLGLGLANGAGGWILQNWGWRNAFYIAAVPGILCAVAALMMREPARGTREVHAVGARRRPGNPYLLVLSIPTILWIIVSGALHNFNMYALGAFVSPFLVRFHHMTFFNAGWVAAVRLRLLRHHRADRRRLARRSPLREARRRPDDRRHGGDRHLRAADVPRPARAPPATSSASRS